MCVHRFHYHYDYRGGAAENVQADGEHLSHMCCLMAIVIIISIIIIIIIINIYVYIYIYRERERDTHIYIYIYIIMINGYMCIYIYIYMVIQPCIYIYKVVNLCICVLALFMSTYRACARVAVIICTDHLLGGPQVPCEKEL